MTEIIVPPLSDAEQNEKALIACCHSLHYSFLELGGLLVENNDRSYWSANRHESFRELVEMLGISYSFATRLMGIAKAEAKKLLTRAEILEIGVSKSCLLLPLIARGELDYETKELAKNCPYRDLRLHLHHKIPDEDSTEYLTCPRCGVEIHFGKEMLRRR